MSRKIPRTNRFTTLFSIFSETAPKCMQFHQSIIIQLLLTHFHITLSHDSIVYGLERDASVNANDVSLCFFTDKTMAHVIAFLNPIVEWLSEANSQAISGLKHPKLIGNKGCRSVRDSI